ncbi:MAG: protein jag [Verrucomicrobiales bacterium]
MASSDAPPTPSPAALTARDLLDTVLGYLGFVVHIESSESPAGLTLQVFTDESELLIGRDGERLDDIQYLLNRLLHHRLPEAPKVRVDIAHYRLIQEDQMIAHIREQADRVRHSGRPVRLPPMNSYQRRLVHNAFKDDPFIKTSSPQDSARLKCITLSRR